MKISEIADRIQRLPDGGIISSKSRWDMEYIYSLIKTYRNKTIGLLYTGSRTLAANTRINASYYQEFYPEYSKFLQESDCFNTFIVPPVVTLDDKSDGFRYVGTPDNSTAFKRAVDRADLSNLNCLSKFAPKDSTFITYMYEQPYMEIYGQNVKEFKIIAVFQDPFQCPLYNKNIDSFPMDSEHIVIMEELIFNANTKPEIQVRPEQPATR